MQNLELNSSSLSPAVLPSLLPAARLCSATAGSRCRLGPAPVSWPAPSPRPAGPGTGTDFSLQLPVPQTADRAPLGRSTASWQRICRTELFFQNDKTFCGHDVCIMKDSLKDESHDLNVVSHVRIYWLKRIVLQKSVPQAAHRDRIKAT